MEEEITYTKKLLDNLVAIDNANLCSGRILEVSQDLDKLIAAYYMESSYEN